MEDTLKNKNFFSKIVKRRENLTNYGDKQREIIKKSKKIGPKVKKWLLKANKYESSANVSYGLFEFPPVIVKGKADLVYDVDGNEYIDCVLGMAASTMGHCHPEIIKAVNKKSNELIHYFEFPTIPKTDLAEELCNNTPGDFDKKVWFSTTGSDATENAVKAARWFTGCQYVLSALGGYHGLTMGTMGITSKGGPLQYNYPLMNNNCYTYFPYAYCYRCAFDKEYPACDMFCVDYIEKNLLTGKETPLAEELGGVSNLAGLIVEPMQCSSGYIIPPDDFLRGLKRLSDKYGFLLMVDEIQTGVGRTGKLWATEHSGIAPDILITGKGFCGGFPMSAIVTKKDILNNWAPGAHVSTFAGWALGCVAGLKAFEIIRKDNLLKRSNEMGKFFYEGLLELQKKYSIIGDVTGGKGLFLAMELVKDKKTKEPAIEETLFIREKARYDGFLFESGGYFYNRIQIIPPLTIKKSSIERALKILDGAFAAAMKQYH